MSDLDIKTIDDLSPEEQEEYKALIPGKAKKFYFWIGENGYPFDANMMPTGALSYVNDYVRKHAQKQPDRILDYYDPEFVVTFLWKALSPYYKESLVSPNEINKRITTPQVKDALRRIFQLCFTAEDLPKETEDFFSKLTPLAILVNTPWTPEALLMIPQMLEEYGDRLVEIVERIEVLEKKTSLFDGATSKATDGTSSPSQQSQGESQ
ncbi:MAG: hypothetical protein DRP85_04165 [Candidatus Makaraimicrobium thalassicum]|nr:MAG: hypothetical protein DRP85_04165 [Candidatus Omnitrophota bacterium]